jgi:hypothetical protein
MEFIEMSGRTLLRVITANEVKPEDLSKIGLTKESIVRVNRQGDLELRSARSWELIGGLLGNFEERIKKQTGLDWVGPDNDEEG